jgi:ribose 1,5-bisphosphokinase PhnN
MDSELREAEAVVVVGPERAGEDGLDGGAGLLCPGLVSARTRAAWEAAKTAGGRHAAMLFALAVERAVPADLAVLWQADGTVTAGEGRARFAALAARPARLTPSERGA